MPKRRKTDEVDDVEEATPRKTRRTGKGTSDVEQTSTPAATPTQRKSILRATPRKVNGIASAESTPKSLRKVLFSTPNKEADEYEKGDEETPTAVRNDRSARKKSAKALQRPTVEEGSDDEENAQEEALAKQILDEEDSDNEEAEDQPEPSSTPATPKRGRPKGKRRERTPSPPPDLPPHELFFYQNRTGANKTSANTLPAHVLLNHEDYFTQVRTFKDNHEPEIKALEGLHKRAFEQWLFELEEGFNICLYGYGSQRELMMEFAEYAHQQSEKAQKIVVVNGYTPGLTVRDILTTIAGAVLPKNTKLPAQPAATVDLMLSVLAESPPARPLQLIIHSLDHVNLRKALTQALLARLAAHPSITVIASCDTPNFPLLWDVSLLRQYRWLYHDATTFKPYTAELDVVEEVNTLLGRSSRRLAGKDGVAYVLKSLPENARNLFRILVAEQLALADFEPHTVPGAAEDDLDPDDILGAEDEDEAAAEQNTPSKRIRGKKGRPAKTPKPKKPAKTVVTIPEGVEYRTLYHKAVEEFVCSSELNFRTLLKEFHDHQMIESKKDAMGTERLVVPFRREELETMLEELV